MRNHTLSTPVFVQVLAAVALALACGAALGCGLLSRSSESVSDSIEHSSDSVAASSRSSSPDHDHDHDADQTRYQHDVEQYTVAFLEAGGRTDASFFSGLGDVARRHGVSDWENEPSTWEAIGRGLARSPATPAERSAYQAAWTGGDAAKQDAVTRGITAIQ